MRPPQKQQLLTSHKMKKIKVVVVLLLLLFFVDGCHTHLHFSPAFAPNTHLESNTKKDTITKKRSHDKNIKRNNLHK
jgi:hypothetical protein